MIIQKEQTLSLTVHIHEGWKDETLRDFEDVVGYTCEVKAVDYGECYVPEEATIIGYGDTELHAVQAALVLYENAMGLAHGVRELGQETPCTICGKELPCDDEGYLLDSSGDGDVASVVFLNECFKSLRGSTVAISNKEHLLYGWALSLSNWNTCDFFPNLTTVFCPECFVKTQGKGSKQNDKKD